jgi:hypothetical protein
MGDIFDSVAAQPQAQPQQQPVSSPTSAPPATTAGSGDIFDSVAAEHSASTPSTTPPVGGTQPPPDKGYLSGLWDSTVGGVATLGKSMLDYYKKKADEQGGVGTLAGNANAIAHTAVPSLDIIDKIQAHPKDTVQVLKDAAKDPEHPLSRMVTGIVQSHIQTAQKAWASQKQAYATMKQSIDAARRGDFNSAESLATQADMYQTEAMSHGLATAVPILGPAADKVGEDIGSDQTGYGAGEATGLIGSVVAPELAGRGVSKVLGKVAPRTTEIAGESIPVRASQESGTANALENVAPSKELSKFDINKTQPAARRAIGKVASDVESKEISSLESKTDKYPVSIEHDAEGNVVNADGRHRVVRAWENGDKSIPVTTKLADGTVEVLNQAPESVANKMGLGNSVEEARQTLDATDAQQPYRAGNGEPRQPVYETAGAKPSPDMTPVKPVNDFGERADQIRAQSQPVFKKLDDLTEGDETKFSELQKQEKMAYRRGDYDAAKIAKDAQEKVLDQYKDEFAPEDFKNARANWAKASRLDKIDASLNTKAVVGPTPIEFRVKGQPDPGYLNGKAFSKQILKLRNDGDLVDLSPEHIQSLEDLGALLEKGNNVHKVGQLARLTETAGAGLGGIMHPAAAVAGAKAALPAYLVYRLLGRVMTNPETASSIVNLLKAGEPVAPVVATHGINRSDDGTR